ncbi:hypothetical protein [Streptomyces sp. NPDC021224]|uniref:hypothetical protein n=1 Tax=unclassified Streptomyces TaxID=2593676 RepID=UPI0037AF06E1
MLPYTETTDATYPEAAARTFVVESYGAGVDLLRGPCPRCFAFIDIPYFRETIKSGTAFGEEPDDPRGEPVICTCDEEHEGRPADRKGCGAYWNFVI